MNFYKILNEKEIHHGLKYHDGLNVDPLPFDPSGNCKPGGIYFAREDILAFLNFDSVWIRKVTVPPGDPIYENPSPPKKWKAKRVILGPRRRINSQVIKELVKEGANIHARENWALTWAAERGYLAVVKLLVSKGVNVHTANDCALMWAVVRGHFNVVKFLVSKGADVCAVSNYALILATRNGHVDVVKFLVSEGADVHTKEDYALRLAATNGFLDIVKFLVSKGTNIHVRDDEALRRAAENGHLNVVNYLQTCSN